ncbi:hypothetical protein ACWC3X_42015 [Streptomyces populi]
MTTPARPGDALPAQPLPTGVPGLEAVPVSSPPAPRGTGVWVYSIGRIVPRFPDLGLEKEFAQTAGGIAPGEAVGTEQLRAVLARSENAYLAALICWTFVAGDVDVFTLRPRDAAGTAALIEAIVPAADAERTVQAVVGSASPA